LFYFLDFISVLPVPNPSDFVKDLKDFAESTDNKANIRDFMLSLKDPTNFDFILLINNFMDYLENDNYAVVKNLMHRWWKDLRKGPVCKYLKSIKKLIKVYQFVEQTNTSIPFFLDLVSAPQPYYDITQTNGVLKQGINYQSGSFSGQVKDAITNQGLAVVYELDHFPKGLLEGLFELEIGFAQYCCKFSC
jgi:hypothetical protein